jgi:photosystem II stability/assembly factor-like uncharacterized protein
MKIRSGAFALLLMAALVAVAAGGAAPPGGHLLPVDAGLVTSFAFNPSNPNIVYVGTVPSYNKGRVYKTIDGGKRWRLISGRQRRWTWPDALAADAQRPRTLYVGTGNAVYKTTDGGRSWRASTRGLLPPPGVNRGEGWVGWLAVDPTKSDVVYEGDYANTIRKSVNGGRSWQPVLSRWQKGGIAGLLMVPRHPAVIYGAFSISGPRGGKPGVYVTTDGGKKWRYTGPSVSDSQHGAVVAFAADSQRGTIYVAVRGRVFSATAGHPWHFIGLGLPPDAVVTGLAAGAGTVYAAFGEKGIYKTNNEGRTWTQSWPDSGPAPGLGAGIIAVDSARPTTIYASAYYPGNRTTATHILRSTDGGLTWTVAG